jgi:general secretion pathway protein G
MATCLPAIICGHMALSRINRSPELYRGRGLAITGLVLGYLLPIGVMIMAGAFVTMRGKLDAAKVTQVEEDFSSLSNDLSIYKLNAGHYPTTQQGFMALVQKPSTVPMPRIWARVRESIPVDPWGNPYTYLRPGKKNPSGFEIICNGPDGLPHTNDDMSSQEM